MSSRGYDHLNADPTWHPKVVGEGVEVRVSIPKLAKALVEANYGVHRMLKALTDEVKAGGEKKYGTLHGEIVAKLEKTLWLMNAR